MATIIVFVSSLFVASILVLAKSVEIKCGKQNSALGLICRLDSKSEKLLSVLKREWLRLGRGLWRIISVESKAALRELFGRIEKRIIDEYNIKQKTIMGRRDIVNRGSASFYLKKIAESKNGVKGKIE